MAEDIIGGKLRPSLSNADKALLRAALHTEGVLTGDYAASVKVRIKLGLGPLPAENEE